MKNIVCILASILVATSSFAGDKTRSFTDKVTGGSLVVTNLEEHSAFELERVEFILPTAVLTNVFTITQNRLFRLPGSTYSIVETNLATAVVTTNTSYYLGSSAEFSHTNTIATTTNNTSVQVYDQDDFGMGMTFEQADIATFGFTETNAFYLIRVYEVYPRP